jgi:exonuclease SbcC
MALFSRFFKSKQPETLEQRIAALEHFSQEQLAQAALNGEPDALRQAAVKRLMFGTALLELTTRATTPPGLQSSARKRLGELLDSGELSVSTLSQSVPDQNLLLALCGYSSSAGLALLEQIHNEALLLEIASEGTTTQLRQAATHKLVSRAFLEQLAKLAKTKDKSVYKIVRTKLDVFKEEKSREQQMAAEISAICSQAEQLAKRNVDEIFTVRKQQIENAWQNMAEKASAELRNRYQQALQKCQQKLDEVMQHEQLIEAARRAEREAKHEIYKALQGLQDLVGRLLSHPNPQELEAELAEKTAHSENALRDAQSKGLETGKETKQVHGLAQTAKQLMLSLRETGPLSHLLEELKSTSEEHGRKIKAKIETITNHVKTLHDVTLPDVIQRSQETLDAWTQTTKERAEQIKHHIHDASELIRKGNWAITQGYVGRARAMYRDLEEKLSGMEQIPSHLAGKLEEFKLAMQKLGDWHEFAVNPKKEELVQKMRGLETSSLHPKDLAEKIQALQESWKELCRGGQHQDETLWEEFHTAAQKAYEPCKNYFEEQNQVREQNAGSRRTLLEQLTEYLNAYDWDHANWKEVEKTLRVSREAWMSYWPVPRKDSKELQQSFDQLMDQLYEKVNQEYERNRLKKKALADQAKSLLETKDTGAAIEAAKKLQSQWQAIGACKRKDDQSLWQEFRASCDAIFEKRHQETAALKEERHTAKQQAETILHELEAVLALAGEEFLAARQRQESLAEAFQSVGELPRDDAKQLVQRFHHLNDQIQAKIQQERQASVTRAWQEAFSWADKIRLCELQYLNHTPPSPSPEDIKTAISTSTIKWPYDSRDLLNQRLTNIVQLTPQDQKLGETKLRELCIRSEILTGRDTPVGDKALRMQYQVVQLQQNFGTGRETNDQTMLDLFSEWLAVPAAPDSVYPTLWSRFAQCWFNKI